MQARKPFPVSSKRVLAVLSGWRIIGQSSCCKADTKTVCDRQRTLNQWQHPLILASTVGLLGMAGGWVVIGAIAPAVVHAHTTTSSITLDARTGESYERFLHRVEAAVGAAIQRSFDRDPYVSEVSVVVLGQKGGASAQVLSLQVSQTQWLNRPDVRRWATYYRSAASLLRFGEAAPGIQPPATPVVTEKIAAPTQSPDSPSSSSASAPANPVSSEPAPLPFPSPNSLPQPPIRIQPGTTPLPPSR